MIIVVDENVRVIGLHNYRKRPSIKAIDTMSMFAWGISEWEREQVDDFYWFRGINLIRYEYGFWEEVTAIVCYRRKQLMTSFEQYIYTTDDGKRRGFLNEKGICALCE